MAARKMTFSIPEELAQTLVQRIPARERSLFLVEALEAKLRGQDDDIARACLAANQDSAAQALEQEWDSIQDGLEDAGERP